MSNKSNVFISNKTISSASLLGYTKKMAELKLNHTVPIVAFEGLTVKGNEDKSIDMLFFQKTQENTDTVLGNVVAAVHIPDKKRWEQIKELVDSQFKQAENREP